MNKRAIQAIVYKDIKVISQSKSVWMPLIIVPLILFVALPGLAALAPAAATIPASSLESLDSFMANMPPDLQAQLEQYNEAQRWIVLSLVYFLAPIYLIVPLMVASVIGADSFAGEKERKTLEALIYTPTSDHELFLAKALSAWLPAVAVSLSGFVLYSVVANLAAWSTMGQIFFPNAMWVILALWVAPAAAGLGLSTMVLVSARARGFQEAYQIGSAVVLPILVLVIGQAAGVMYFSISLVALLGLVLWTINAILLWFGGQAFRRGEIIAQL
ncbi:MAG: ABC transporter permease subunit [Phycisphaerae bacterium]|nr:ABC transporter permease subunit [Phycisphaerae bacterium]